MAKPHRRLTILIADDEPEILDLMRMMLEWENYTVVETQDGEQCLEQARILKDGQTTRPFETLAEVHILRREAAVPAPTYDDVKGMIREGMAFKRAREWIQYQLKDERVVKIRWPLPDMNVPR